MGDDEADDGEEGEEEEELDEIEVDRLLLTGFDRLGSIDFFVLMEIALIGS